MIIYYDKQTGRIYGTILGRVHNEFELKPDLVQPQGVPKGQIARKVFTLEQTKEVEKFLEAEQMKIMDCVVEDLADDIVLKRKPEDPKSKPNSVETIRIDLKRPLDDIYADFSEATKRTLKALEGTEMVFEEVSFYDRDILFQVFSTLEEEKEIYLSKHLLNVRHNFIAGVTRAYVVWENDTKTNPLSAVVVESVGGVFKYTLASTTQEGKDKNAGYFMVWNLIKDAKYLGVFNEFDFGGLFAEWETEERKKVNDFKQRWGGKTVPLI